MFMPSTQVAISCIFRTKIGAEGNSSFSCSQVIGEIATEFRFYFTQVKFRRYFTESIREMLPPSFRTKCGRTTANMVTKYFFPQRRHLDYPPKQFFVHISYVRHENDKRNRFVKILYSQYFLCGISSLREGCFRCSQLFRTKYELSTRH